jgi:hypothetical protein
MPWFGGLAKHEIECRGHVPVDGTFDDCFNDCIPFLEIGAPILAVPLLFLFGAFAMAVWSPPPNLRRHAWRLAPGSGTAAYHPKFVIVCLIGVAWCLWRAWLYPLDELVLPFTAFWLVFSAWFAGAALVCWHDAREAEDE